MFFYSVGADFHIVSSSVTIPAGQRNGYVLYEILMNNIVEGDKMFTAQISTVSTGAVIGNPSKTVVTITDMSESYCAGGVSTDCVSLTTKGSCGTAHTCCGRHSQYSCELLAWVLGVALHRCPGSASDPLWGSYRYCLVHRCPASDPLGQLDTLFSVR